MIYTCTIDSPLGSLRAAAEGHALIGLWFEGQRYYPPDWEGWAACPEDSVFEALRVWIRAYFAGGRPLPPIPLAPRGTAFQREVWKLLGNIPYGATSTYGAIARRLTAQRSEDQPRTGARAVGGAAGHNPISLLIPCHRVVGSDGNLTGYAGGLERKRALLEMERGTAPIPLAGQEQSLKGESNG